MTVINILTQWCHLSVLVFIGDRFHEAGVPAAQLAVPVLWCLQLIDLGPVGACVWRERRGGCGARHPQTRQRLHERQPGRRQRQHHAGVLPGVVLLTWHGAPGCGSGGKCRPLFLLAHGDFASCSLFIHQSHPVTPSFPEHGGAGAPCYNCGGDSVTPAKLWQTCCITAVWWVPAVWAQDVFFFFFLK